jgi:hypothetical protein
MDIRVKDKKAIQCKYEFYVRIHCLAFKRSIFDGIKKITEYKEYRDTV